MVGGGYLPGRQAGRVPGTQPGVPRDPSSPARGTRPAAPGTASPALMGERGPRDNVGQVTPGGVTGQMCGHLGRGGPAGI